MLMRVERIDDYLDKEIKTLDKEIKMQRVEKEKPAHLSMTEELCVEFKSKIEGYRAEYAKFEKRVFIHLYENRERYGIEKIYIFKNMVVDGALRLDNGKIILLEAKFKLNWFKVCNARVEFQRFLKEERVQKYFTEHISKKSPEGALIIFDSFSGDWIGKGWSNFYEEENILDLPSIPIRIAQLNREDGLKGIDC